MNDFDQAKPDDAWGFINDAPGEDELDVRAIHDFVVHLKEEKIHPILIFGTSRSGKTMMILSLLHYAKQNARADMRIQLGDPVFPPNFPYADERYRDAEQFYNLLTIEYARGERPPSTQKIVPFFIPINIEVRGETHKLAFLEGNGEWYERDDYSFRQFKQEIAGVLSGFAAPVSVIFVAPTRDERGRSDRSSQNFSHECLAHCVEHYERRRLVRDRDNLLLLLSKWDALHNPGRADGHFSDASVGDVLSEIEPWHFIWQQFGNLNGPNRALTPFSAGWINENGMFVREDTYQSVFDKFNRTVWNWIFGNITAANSKETPPVRGNLYEDVEIQKPKAPTLYQSIINKSLWI
jgi:hypothetical protein